ncbi:MAG: GNAT family N-acetyltransferase [Bacteroidetes bacterium]|nr:MAG: GNAT family N-acetyltransferase [Bacteroidota bacterium]
MIRKYEVKDVDGIIDTWYQASMLAHPFLDSRFIEQEKHNIRNVYLPNTDTWVFESDNEVVAFIAMIENEVGAIFAKPDFHGQGIGKQLMDFVAEKNETLEVEVFQNNSIGRAFYEKYGFSEIGNHIHEETGFKLLRLRYEKNK